MATRTYHHGNLKAALQDAVVEIVASEGTAGVSMARVATMAGVSPGAPYRHYDTLDALVGATAAAAYQRLHDHLDVVLRDMADADPEEILHTLIREYFEFCRNEPGAFRLIFDSRISDRSTLLHPLARQDYELVEGLVARIVGVPTDRCRELALSVSAVIMGNVQLHLQGYSPVSTFDEAPALAAHGVRLLLAGFRAS